MEALRGHVQLLSAHLLAMLEPSNPPRPAVYPLPHSPCR